MAQFLDRLDVRRRWAAPRLVWGCAVTIVWTLLGVSSAAYAQIGPPNTYAAEPLNGNLWVEATLNGRDDRHVYRFRAADGDTVTVETRGNEADPLCILYDASRRELARDDDGGFMRNCRMEMQLPRGEYFVEIRSAWPSERGTYELRYTTTRARSAQVYGSSRTHAPKLRPRQNVTATMTSRGEHWYELEVGADDLAVVELHGMNGLECALVDAQGKELLQGRRSGGASCQLEAPGSARALYLRVRGRGTSDVGDYELRFRSERLRDDHGNSRYGATRLRSRSSIDGYLTSGDSDFFEFTPGNGRRVRVFTSSDVQTDTLCVLYDARGRELARDDNRGGSRQCRLEFEGDGERYFLEVRGAMRSVSGPYRVRYED